MNKEEEQLVEFFKQSGADEAQSRTMAKQMIKRVGQLSRERGWTEVEALRHLLKLFVEAQSG
jgi:hypothetical protein